MDGMKILARNLRGKDLTNFVKEYLESKEWYINYENIKKITRKSPVLTQIRDESTNNWTVLMLFYYESSEL
jgi:hypothetical protein